MDIVRKVLYLILVLCIIGIIALGIYQGQEASFSDYVKIGGSLVAAIGALIGVRGKNSRGLKFYEKQYEKELEGAFASDKDSRKQLLKAARLYNDAKEQKAVKLLQKLLDKCQSRQDYASVLLFLALNYSEIGMLQDAVDAYKRMLQYDPTNSTAYSNLGLLYMDMGNYDAAIESYQQAVKHDPENPFAYNNLASVYFRKNEYDLAIPYAEKSLKLKGNMYQAASVLAIMYARKGDTVKGEHYYRIAVDNGQDKRALRYAMENT